jgi:hypothetical protein
MFCWMINENLVLDKRSRRRAASIEATGVDLSGGMRRHPLASKGVIIRIVQWRPVITVRFECLSQSESIGFRGGKWCWKSRFASACAAVALARARQALQIRSEPA